MRRAVVRTQRIRSITHDALQGIRRRGAAAAIIPAKVFVANGTADLVAGADIETGRCRVAAATGAAGGSDSTAAGIAACAAGGVDDSEVGVGAVEDRVGGDDLGDGLRNKEEKEEDHRRHSGVAGNGHFSRD